jgi:hypothetical protein
MWRMTKALQGMPVHPRVVANHWTVRRRPGAPAPETGSERISLQQKPGQRGFLSNIAC